jgi:hypothetical protein
MGEAEDGQAEADHISGRKEADRGGAESAMGQSETRGVRNEKPRKPLKGSLGTLLAPRAITTSEHRSSNPRAGDRCLCETKWAMAVRAFAAH